MKHQGLAATILAACLSAAPAQAEPSRVVNPGTPAPDCTFHVNYDRNADLPGYRSGAGCIPFMPLNQLIPEGQGLSSTSPGSATAQSAAGGPPARLTRPAATLPWLASSRSLPMSRA